MQILKEKPKCWDRLVKAFGVSWDSGVVVTYGGKIHTQSGMIAPEFLVHELVHVHQQEGKDPDEFLEKYIADKQFRLDMELPAYRVQVAYIKATESDETQLFLRLHILYRTMARNYGDMCTYEQAKELLS